MQKMMEHTEDVLLYEGKAKKIFSTHSPSTARILYKDDATAFNGKKSEKLAGKGRLNNEISSFFFDFLFSNGIMNHFVDRLSETEQLVDHLKIIPLEVVIRNIAAGSLCKRIGWEEGKKLPSPLVEFYYKNDDLGDPLFSESHIKMLKLATESQLSEMQKIGLKTNRRLQKFLKTCNILLVDFKLEFGVNSDGQLVIGDEISPDTCRFWDVVTKERLDKDRFRCDLGGVIEAYEEILRRLIEGEKCWGKPFRTEIWP